MSVLLDTSVLIDRERVAAVGDLAAYGTWGISAVTLSELSVGVLLARTPAQRSRRLRTYELASDVQVYSFDDVTARTHAELVAWARSHGFTPAPLDGMIAATAATNGMPLLTADHGFARLADFEGFDVVVL